MEKEFENFDDEEELVNVDGTKVKLSGKVLKVRSYFSKLICRNLIPMADNFQI
jgi:hypothetical protein